MGIWWLQNDDCLICDSDRKIVGRTYSHTQGLDFSSQLHILILATVRLIGFIFQWVFLSYLLCTLNKKIWRVLQLRRIYRLEQSTNMRSLLLLSLVWLFPLVFFSFFGSICLSFSPLYYVIHRYTLSFFDSVMSHAYLKLRIIITLFILQLLWIILVASCAALIIQSLAARLGVVTGWYFDPCNTYVC